MNLLLDESAVSVVWLCKVDGCTERGVVRGVEAAQSAWLEHAGQHHPDAADSATWCDCGRPKGRDPRSTLCPHCAARKRWAARG